MGFAQLINLLESENPSTRNTSALKLRVLKDNRAIEPLLKAIFKVENKEDNGTLVYALQTLDCKHKLVELFKVLFYQGYEAKVMAHQILDEQIFEFTKNDLLEIRKMWKAINQNNKVIEDDARCL